MGKAAQELLAVTNADSHELICASLYLYLLCLQNLQREIKSLQGEIASMGKAAQELLAVTNADSHELIRASLNNLNDRVHLLEGTARDQGNKLRSVDRNYKLYKVDKSQLAFRKLLNRLLSQ